MLVQVRPRPKAGPLQWLASRTCAASFRSGTYFSTESFPSRRVRRSRFSVWPWFSRAATPLIPILIAMVAMLLTAVSYGRMAAVYPSAGSAYAYVGRGLNPHLGFLAGWAMLLDYLVIPTICAIFAALTIQRAVTGVPYIVWVGVFAGTITFLNLWGIRATCTHQSGPRCHHGHGTCCIHRFGDSIPYPRIRLGRGILHPAVLQPSNFQLRRTPHRHGLRRAHLWRIRCGYDAGGGREESSP